VVDFKHLTLHALHLEGVGSGKHPWLLWFFVRESIDSLC